MRGSQRTGMGRPCIRPHHEIGVDTGPGSTSETTTPNLQNVRAKLLARCLCDEHGERLFNDAEVEALGAKSAAALDRVFKVAQTLNGIGEKEIEELAGH